MADHLDPGHLFEHVKDAPYFELPREISSVLNGVPREEAYRDPHGGRVELPQLTSGEPIVAVPESVAASGWVEPLEGRFTKFMVLELVAAIIVCVLFIRLASKIGRKEATRGRFANMLESMLLFIRDQVARPAIGAHDADAFLPFLWTIFFFVLACNLLGMVPWMGSPTGSLAVTGALALITFGTVVGAGSAKMGPVGFWIGQVPHMDLPLPLAIFLKPMVFVIEVLGLFIKHFVLAVRLVANMFAGHLVLGVLLAFIAVVWHSKIILTGVMPASILGATALSFLELFVAFLQAYIFTFLSALFIGAAVHPH
jgi:F-type H+-transporting ATPase subunit a